MMHRRKALGVIGAAVLCPLCVSDARAADAGQGAAPWGYQGDLGPDRWSRLAPEYRVCGLGMAQTPIDLRATILADTGQLSPDYAPTAATVLNNGHTIRVLCPTGGGVEIDRTRYRLQQFHFHHPSEHLLAGKGFDLECHLVHASNTGDLAVIALFIRPGEHNLSLAPIWQVMPSIAGQQVALDQPVDPADLLPQQRGYYRYVGSTTTPPCSEGVVWSVMRMPVEASVEQIRRFASLFPMNARPVMPVNRRYVLESI